MYKLKAPFLDEIYDLGIIKLLALDKFDTLIMKVNLREIRHFLKQQITPPSHSFRSRESYSDHRYQIFMLL